MNELKTLLPNYDKSLAIDNKAIQFFVNHRNKHSQKDSCRDGDADYGVKS